MNNRTAGAVFSGVGQPMTSRNASRRARRRRGQAGFTLIELLVVLVILACWRRSPARG